MRASATSSGIGPRLLRRAPLLAASLAGCALLMLALGPIGWRAQWWPLRTSFTLLSYAAYCGLAAAILSALSLLPGRAVIGRRGIILGLIGVVLGAAVAYVPWRHRAAGQGLPAIHDITTDPANPPEFQAVVPLRAAQGGNPASYEGPRVGDQQRKAYPDIAPLLLDRPPEEAFRQALDGAKRLGWTIVAADPAAGRIEASDRSLWFGFTDDVVVRITPAGSGSRVDVRSSSRLGRGDFGANAARIRRYLAILREAPSPRT